MHKQGRMVLHELKRGLWCLNLASEGYISVSYFFNVNNCGGDRGSTVVKVLCYKSESHWFDPSWYQWIFH